MKTLVLERSRWAALNSSFHSPRPAGFCFSACMSRSKLSAHIPRLHSGLCPLGEGPPQSCQRGVKHAHRGHDPLRNGLHSVCQRRQRAVRPGPRFSLGGGLRHTPSITSLPRTPVSRQVLHTYSYAAALHRVVGQLRALSAAVAERVAPTLLEDAADYWERAVRSAVLEYRRRGWEGLTWRCSLRCACVLSLLACL